MGRYTTFDEVKNRYSIARDDGPSNVESTYIFFAESELDSLLAPYFATPFSSDNITAKDLAIDLTYYRLSNFKVAERQEFRDMVMSRIDGIIKGDEAMITTSGTTINTLGGTVYSNTMNYHPTFSMLDAEEQLVDVDFLESEANERNY